MRNKLLNYLIAGALGTTLALTSPALAFHGGGGGMHGGGMGGGMHFGGMGGGMHFGGMGGGHFGTMSGGMRFGGAHFSGGRFAGERFSHAAFSPRFSRFAFRDRGRFFHGRFHRFAFVGAPFVYAAYGGCWRRVWTPYGWEWANACSNYSYY